MTHCSACCYVPSTKTIQLQRKGQPVLSHRLSTRLVGEGSSLAAFLSKKGRAGAFWLLLFYCVKQTCPCALQPCAAGRQTRAVPRMKWCSLGWAAGGCPFAQSCSLWISWNGWVERDPKDHLIPATTGPGCSKLYPSSPWPLPGMGQPQLPWATCAWASPPSQRTFF